MLPNRADRVLLDLTRIIDSCEAAIEYTESGDDPDVAVEVERIKRHLDDAINVLRQDDLIA